MRELRTIITDNKYIFPELEYYNTVIDVIEEKSKTEPDIVIESCKSLIEGLSKFILSRVDNTYSVRDDGKIKTLFTKTLDKLTQLHPAPEVNTNFVENAVTLIIDMSSLRNKRGDISHGRNAPKLMSSSLHLSMLITRVTEGIAVYLLEVFLSIDLSYQEQIKYESNSAFNESLDDLYSLPYDLSYSQALFEQDYTSYEEQLQDYRTNQDDY